MPAHAAKHPIRLQDPPADHWSGLADGLIRATSGVDGADVTARIRDADVTAEVKRMYVVPAAQRRGLARRMLAHREATAAAEGIEALVLETGMKQPEAISLYLSAGYEPIPGFGHYCGSELSRCFGRRLVPPPPSGGGPLRRKREIARRGAPRNRVLRGGTTGRSRLSGPQCPKGN